MTLDPSAERPPLPLPRLDAVLVLNHIQERLRAAESRAAALERALTSSRRIGIAIGILMCHEQLTPDQAILTLKTHSQRHNVKVRRLAEAVIRTGSIEGSESVALPMVGPPAPRL